MNKSDGYIRVTGNMLNCFDTKTINLKPQNGPEGTKPLQVYWSPVMLFVLVVAVSMRDNHF